MTDNQKIVFDKLDAFIKKYYTNILIKGIIFFIGLGLLYFLFTSLVEYYLWMRSSFRTMLFFAFVIVELFLFGRYIIVPVLKLWKLSKGISITDASILIGKHFSGVNDKLLNFLQLSSHKESSELLIESINQKAKSLSPVPFSSAINFKNNRRFLPILLLPFFAFCFIYLSGNEAVITQSFGRIVRYKEHFSPPAPFELVVVNKSLMVEQGKDFEISVKAAGKILPESATIYVGAEEYIMDPQANGVFTYKFTKVVDDISFFVKSNKVQSQKLVLDVVAVPTISNFSMLLSFPKYLNRKNEIINGSGNAIVPEGTTVSWNVSTTATTTVNFKISDAEVPFQRKDNSFYYNRNITKNVDYQIVTSNKKLKNFETLNYQIATVPDAFPTIEVAAVSDSLNTSSNYVVGQLSDDYGLHKLKVVFYPKGKLSNVKSAVISIANAVVDQFVFSFPSNLAVEKGVNYEYYFEVFDNDALHGYKSSKSAVFSDKVLSDDQRDDQLFEQQNANISSLSKSLKNQDKQMSELEKLKKSAKEKDNLDFNDQQKVNDFLKRQQKQDEQMKNFADKMKENLEKTKADQNNEFKKELEKRLENQLADIEKNKKLLDELKSLNNKLEQEELTEKLDKFKQKSDNQTKNLEQLVELTKRFYVEQKASQMIEKLDKLAQKQDALSEQNAENTKDKQDKINSNFEDIQKELKDLEKENKELKAPIEIPNDVEKQKDIEENLKNASDELKKASADGKEKAKSKQKKSAKQMKEMAFKMKEGMEMDGMEKEEEDAAMLRQILDNLLSFSFSEEQTMSQFKNLKRNSPSYNKSLKQQQDLRLQFKHVDDSLFALGSRNPKITELINNEIGNVHYNIEKALENLVESNVSKGVYHQQYTVSSANKLADMLSESLNSMQMSMSASGKGKPKKGKTGKPGMQLPDIIRKQGELADKASKGTKPGDKKGEKPGSKPGDGKPAQTGKDGRDGENGLDGEGNAGEIMKIYQEQKQLRDALQKELNENGIGPNGQKALDAMKDIEKQLLNKGFKNEVLQKMLNLKQELLKLQQAVQTQGEDQKRQADAAKKQFTNSSNALPTAVKEYLNSIEILNRQSLPLQKNFNDRVQQYFKK